MHVELSFAIRFSPQDDLETLASPADRRSASAASALRTARWARIMIKWLVTHSTSGGVKWQVVSFNGTRGQESAGIVDMIAIRKNHRISNVAKKRGDMFEIVLGCRPFGNLRNAPEEVETAHQD